MSGQSNGVSDDVITAFARISADTKTNIGFADGVADGVTYTNDGEHTIYLNANGTRTVEECVMHELTHAMKGTEGYAELQALAEQYFSTHESEYNEIKERYRFFYKKNNLAFTEDILSDELTAHFVEKQMESRKVLTRMTEDNPTFTKKCLAFLQKIKEHFAKGTNSYADMNSVERKFLSVYNAYKARQHGNGNGKNFAIITDENGNQYVQADRRVIMGDNPAAWKKQITNYINEVIRGGKDIKIKTVEGDTLTITGNTAGKAAFQNAGLSENAYKTKLNAEAHIDEIAQISKAKKNSDGSKKISPDYNNKHAKRNLAKDGWNYRTAYFRDFDGKYYKLQLSIAIDGTIESIYNVGSITEKHLSGESRLTPQRATSVSNNRISENEENVNHKTNISEKNKRYALPDTVEADVVKQFGKTYRWIETGYILKDGTRVDFSGKNDGAPGGYRTVIYNTSVKFSIIKGTSIMIV